MGGNCLTQKRKARTTLLRKNSSCFLFDFFFCVLYFQHECNFPLSVDETVWEWRVSATARKFPISGTKIQAHAKEVAQMLGRSDFRAYNVWVIRKFHKEHQIVFDEVYGDAGDACEETVVEWLDRHQVTCLKRNLLVKGKKSGPLLLRFRRVSV